MQTETTNFLDELLAEAEIKEEKQTAAYYDLLIAEVSRLENEIAGNFTEAEKEAAIISDWALRKNATLQERSAFLKLKLEAYIREEGKKTIDLPHGVLKIRKSPDKVEISDMEVFLANANSQMVNVVPESVKPDLSKIKAYMKMTGGKPIAGVTVIEGVESFKLTLRNQGEEKE